MTTEREVKVKVIGAGTREDPYRVDLPTYCMVGDSEEYQGQGAAKKLVRVRVRVPADECTKEGRLSTKKIQHKYKGQPKWDRDKVAEDAEIPG